MLILLTLEHTLIAASIVEKCFDIWHILKMAPVKSGEPENNSFSINHIIRCIDLGFYHWDFQNLSCF